MIPDAEKIVGAILRAAPAVSATGARIVGRTPEDTRGPWVRIQQLDAIGTDAPDHLIEFYLQLDCYAGELGISGSQAAQANLLARTVRGELDRVDREGYSDSGAVVTGVSFNSGPRAPDDDFTPARERFICTARVWMHEVVSA